MNKCRRPEIKVYPYYIYGDYVSEFGYKTVLDLNNMLAARQMHRCYCKCNFLRCDNCGGFIIYGTNENPVEAKAQVIASHKLVTNHKLELYLPYCDRHKAHNSYMCEFEDL